uniref:Genome polyprotein n=1 Tax=Beihai picorna-like virus 25 TaxID=1922568 RepID=A0A1L3KHA8_9VIRU|nr:hypothetical protein 1 [Beihai picorna-like virus 25]
MVSTQVCDSCTVANKRNLSSSGSESFLRFESETQGANSDASEGVGFYDAKRVAQLKFERRLQSLEKERIKGQIRRENLKSKPKFCRPKRKQIEELRQIFDAESQSGGLIDIVESIKSVVEEWELPEGLTALLLKVLCFYRSVRKSVDLDQFASITGLFLLSLSESDTRIRQVITDVIFSPNADLMCLKSSDIPESQSGFDFSESMTLLRNLKLIRNNELCRLIMKVVATAFSCGLVKGKKDLYFTEFNLSFVLDQFTRDTSGKATVFDFFDGIFNIIQFIIEKGYICFQQRTFAPLFMSDERSAHYDKDLADVIGYWPSVKAGNYKDTPYCSVPHFANALDNLYIATTALLEQSTDDFSRRYHAKTLKELNTIHAQFKSQERSGGLREAPFAFCIFGKSSVGKSSIMSTLTDYCLKATALLKNPERSEFLVDPRMICSQNAKDKFDSDYKSYSLAVLFDDLANERVEVAKQSPLDAVIRYINNIKSTALKADVHEKGVIQKEPWLVGASTNIKNLQADQYSVEPLSVLRRFNLHIEPFVANEFQKADGIFLDGEKLADADQIIPDAWRFKAYHYEYDEHKPYKQNNNQTTLAYMSVPFSFVGLDNKTYVSDDLDMEQLQWLLYQLLSSHFKAQESVLLSNKRIHAEKLCVHKIHTSICSFCSPSHKKPTPLSHRSPENPPVHLGENLSVDLEPDITPETNDACIVSHSSSFTGGTRESTFKERVIFMYKVEFCVLFLCWLYSFFKHVLLWCYYSDYFARFYRESEDYQRAKRRFEEAYTRVHETAENISQEACWRTRAAYYHGKYYVDAVAWFGYFLRLDVETTICQINQLRFVPWWFVDFLPERWIGDTRFSWIFLYRYDKPFISQAFSFSLLWWMVLYVFLKRIYFVRESTAFAISFTTLLGWLYFSLALRKKFLMKVIHEHRAATRHVLRHTISMTLQTSIRLMLTFGVVVVSYKLVKSIFSTIRLIAKTSQGGDLDIGIEEDNVWLSAVPAPLPKCAPKLATINSEQCLNIVTKNVVACMYGDSQWSSGFYPRSQILLVPAHEVKQRGTFNLRLRKGSLQTLSGGNKSLEISPARIYYFPGKDVAAIYHARFEEKQDLTHLFPYEIPQDRNPTVWVGARPEGHTINGSCSRFGVSRLVRTDKTELHDAIVVRYAYDTAGGDCMKVHVADCRSNAHIVGFHLAGKKTSGYLSCLTQADLRMCYEFFDQKPSTRLTATMGTFKTEKYGKDFTPKPQAHKKSTINYLTDAQLEYYGDLPSYVTRPKSDVITSPVSASVTAHCGVANNYGPPANCRSGPDKIPAQAPYNIYYQGVGNAVQEFPLELVELAIADYLDDCKSNRRMMADLANLRPLTEIETISGQDGVKFVDGMKMATSKGFPLSGCKEDITFHLDPSEFENISDPKIFDEEFMEDWRRAREVYLEGERDYPVFKACTKDEPTKRSKEKVRVFQSAPLTLQCLIRQYYLPIAACMSRNPITTECAVGINSQGPQWNRLLRHLTRFGKDRMVAGDFKAYDQHMSSTMTSTAFSIMIELARLCNGYTDADIRIMSMMVADIVHPVMCVNGDLVQLSGSNPSGQNLTVYVNSIVNSIYQRCVFYTIYPPGSLETAKFQDYVALMTYGDDNIMSVSPKAPQYNHTSMQEVYASRGIEYTMADKDAESVPYVTLEQCDFLKRATSFRPEYTDPTVGGKGMYLACLDEDSIFKSLHCNMLSKSVSRDEIARQCLDGALRELWFHGKECFDKRHEELKRVVAEHGWQHLVAPSFYKTFEEREAEWLEKYGLVKSQSGSIQSSGQSSEERTRNPLFPYQVLQRQGPSREESDLIDRWAAALSYFGVTIHCREYSLDGDSWGDLIVRYGGSIVCIEIRRNLGEARIRAIHQYRQLRLLHFQSPMVGVNSVHAMAITPHSWISLERVPREVLLIFRAALRRL